MPAAGGSGLRNQHLKNDGFTTKEIVAHEKFYGKPSGCQTSRTEVDNVRLSVYSMILPTSERKKLVARVCLTRLLSLQVVKKMQKLVWMLDYV